MLAEARDLGFVGPGPLTSHIDHSRAFLSLAGGEARNAVDLGSGAGLPGLVLARAWPTSRWLLLDSNRRRTNFLLGAVDRLGMGHRVEVRCQRAEETGRDARCRGQVDLVVARSFGPPAVTAECAAPLLQVSGHLITSEPPGGDPDRWPATGLAMIGLRSDQETTAPFALRRFVQAEPCPDRYPRRVGVPAKRPLFTTGGLPTGA